MSAALLISSVDATFEFHELGNRRWSVFFRNLAISLTTRFDLKRYPGSEMMNDFASYGSFQSIIICISTRGGEGRRSGSESDATCLVGHRQGVRNKARGQISDLCRLMNYSSNSKGRGMCIGLCSCTCIRCRLRNILTK